MVGTVDKHVAHLVALSGARGDRDRAFALAADSSGVEKAKVIHDALRGMEIPHRFLPAFYSAEIAQIAESDPEDTLGFGKLLRDREAIVTMSEKLDDLYDSKKWDAAIKYVENTIEEVKPEGEILQEMLLEKLYLFEEKGDFEGALPLASKIEKIEPSSQFGKSATESKEIYLRKLAESKKDQE